MAPAEPPETFFRTSELVGRRFTPDDLADFLALRGDPAVALYQDWESFTEAEARRFIAAQGERHPGEPGWFQFALERVADGVFVGDCGLRILESDHRLAQIGYTIVAGYWGRGYATAVVRALVDYAFGTFPIHRLTASVDPRNTGSVRVLEKAGFAKEAHFRQSYWFKGEWTDDAIYAVLAPQALR